MEVRKLPSDLGVAPREAVRQVIAAVSDELYGGNLILRDSRDLSRTGARFTLRVEDRTRGGWRYTSGGLGDRRRSVCACWYAVRDGLAGLFAAFPEAVVHSSLGREGAIHYIGRDGFAETFPATGARNIGSEFSPAYMPELCGDLCEHSALTYARACEAGKLAGMWRPLGSFEGALGFAR